MRLRIGGDGRTGLVIARACHRFRSPPVRRLMSIYDDKLIACIECCEEFVWTAGEQEFFHQKELSHPPKRCKRCKRAKNRRIEAVELSRITGQRQPLKFRATCAQCSATTTVPFFPSQGRPVYCQKCYIDQQGGNEQDSETQSSAANG